MGPEELRAHLLWTVETWSSVREEAGDDVGRLRVLLRRAHDERGAELGRTRRGGPRSRQVAALLATDPLAPVEAIHPAVWKGILAQNSSTLPVVTLADGEIGPGLQWELEKALRSGPGDELTGDAASGDGLREMLAIRALERGEGQAEAYVSERLPDATFRERLARTLEPPVRPGIGRFLAGCLGADAELREACLRPDDPLFATAVAALLDAGERSADRDELLGRLLRDDVFAAAALPHLRRTHQRAIADRVVAALSNDADAARVDRLASLPAEAVAGALAEALVTLEAVDGASDPERSERLAAAARRAALASRAPAIEHLVLESDAPLDALIAAEEPGVAGVPEVLRVLAGGIIDRRASRRAEALERARSLRSAARGALARRLVPTLEGLKPHRRRRLVDAFAELADASCLPTLIAALRWDDGRYMDVALGAMRRITGLSFADPRRSKRLRDRQILEIERWWLEEGVDEHAVSSR